MNNEKTIREKYQEFEESYLHERAAFSTRSRGRIIKEKECPIRTIFQRDRDRIIHSKSFRRLKQTTQVFISPLGDHYRTRLTHTLEVAQIARTVARSLRLNEDLTEAIALGHDLGHTPFGHTGEEVLSLFLDGKFHHAEQSLRVVEKLENDGEGLNLCHEVREGIANHSKGMKPIAEFNSSSSGSTLEADIMRIADIVAYVNHDLDDALRAGLITHADIPPRILNTLGDSHSHRINNIVLNLIYTSREKELETISLSTEMAETLDEARIFLNEKVYRHPRIQKEADKALKIVNELCEYFLKSPEKIDAFGQRSDDEDIKRVIADSIAGMTDRYAIHLFSQLYIPHPTDA